MRHRQQKGRQATPLAGILGLLMVSAVNAQDVATTAATTASTAWPDPATSPAQMLSLEQIERSLLLDATNSRDRAVVVGDRGHILVSESRSEWRQVASPTRSMLTAVTAVGNKLWAVGHDQVVIYSSDGGLTWTLQHHDITAEGPLLDVLFLDEERGYAIGAYGQFLSTTDSGANWTVELISDRVASGAPADQADNLEIDPDSGLASSDMGTDEGDPHLNAIVQNPLGLLIVGETGSAYRSTDEGLSWVRETLPYEGSMFGAVALDNGTILAFGLRGNAFATGDLGRTWRQLQTGTEASLLGGAAVSGSRAVLVGASGTVLLLPAGSDQMRGYTFSDGGVMSGVLPLGETDFLTVGENGVATYQPN
ncbi:MAG: YCF48-related protein [Lysobacterales bacterium]